MSVWIRNLRSAVRDKSVVLLHGNVRDQYIDEDGRLYENLTALLRELAKGAGQSFSEFVVHDLVRGERHEALGAGTPAPPSPAPAAPQPAATSLAELELSSAAREASGRGAAPERTLEAWGQDLADRGRNRFRVLFYLDKLVPYRQSYGEAEQANLLRLEKAIENITPNNRLVLVALLDTMVPVEIYTHSPKVRVLAIPSPDQQDRERFIARRWPDPARVTLVGQLTDGLYLREIARVVEDPAFQAELPERELRRLVDRYRIGEQDDHWGQLDIRRIEDAFRVFTQDEGIVGQDEPLRRVIDTVRLARAGLAGLASGTPTKPKGILFFAGPTGVGKTLVAKKLARFLFGSEDAFVRIDMSELKEAHSISKLIGSPPGYVGFEQGGQLTNAVRERPFSVVLFDEIEKAHPRILDTFLQLLDEGRLTDSRGQTVFFTETIIVFTSNIGARDKDSREQPIGEADRLEALRANTQGTPDEQRRRVEAHFRGCVEAYFLHEISRPELLNRVGNNIIPFNFISESGTQLRIVNAHLDRIRKTFADQFRAAGHTLVVEPGVAEWFVEKHGDKIRELGGRGVTHLLGDGVVVPLSRIVLFCEHRRVRNQEIVVHREAAGIGVCCREDLPGA